MSKPRRFRDEFFRDPTLLADHRPLSGEKRPTEGEGTSHHFQDESWSSSDEEEPLFGGKSSERGGQLSGSAMVVLCVLISWIAAALASAPLGMESDEELPSEYGIDSIVQGIALGFEEVATLIGIVFACLLSSRGVWHTRALTLPALLCVAQPILLLSGPLTSHRYIAVRVSRALSDGLLDLASTSLAVACLSPALTPRAFSALSLAPTLGLLTGPPLTVALERIPSSSSFLVASCALATIALVAAIVLRGQAIPTQHRKRTKRVSIMGSYRGLLTDGGVVAGLVLVFVAWAVFSIWSSVLPWHFHLHHTKDSDTIMALHFAAYVTGCITALLFTPVFPLPSPASLAWGAAWAFAAVLSSVGLFHAHLTLTVDYVGAILSGIGMGVFVVLIKALLGALAQRHTARHPAANEHVFIGYFVMEALGTMAGRLGGFSAVALFGYAWGQLYAMLALLLLLLLALCIIRDVFGRTRRAPRATPPVPS